MSKVSCLTLFSTVRVSTTAVEMVDIATQSETEDLSDIESNAQHSSRKPSFLQVVPEEEHEDDELVIQQFSNPCLFSSTCKSENTF